MTYKQIEASREARLWIGQIIVPAATIVAGIYVTNSELRFKTKNKFNDLKGSFKNKFSKN